MSIRQNLLSPVSNDEYYRNDDNQNNDDNDENDRPNWERIRIDFNLSWNDSAKILYVGKNP